MKKEYEGTCYIGVVGSDLEYGPCRDSIEAIIRRPGDTLPDFKRATKGFETRTYHVHQCLQSPHAFLLLLDADMTFPLDALERLRSHKLPIVSGLYLKRKWGPMVLVWHKYENPWKWPVQVVTKPPPKGKLMRIGATGWGCILIHREALMAVARLLKGEGLVIEDDMDVWAYDLPTLLGAIRGLRELADQQPGLTTTRAALKAHLETLEREFRLLKGDRTNVGSDIRFGFYAQAAGFEMWGDPDVRCGHTVNYPLTADDYAGQGKPSLEKFEQMYTRELKAERKRVQQNHNNLIGGRT